MIEELYYNAESAHPRFFKQARASRGKDGLVLQNPPNVFDARFDYIEDLNVNIIADDMFMRWRFSHGRVVFCDWNPKCNAKQGATCRETFYAFVMTDRQENSLSTNSALCSIELR